MTKISYSQQSDDFFQCNFYDSKWLEMNIVEPSNAAAVMITEKNIWNNRWVDWDNLFPIDQMRLKRKAHLKILLQADVAMNLLEKLWNMVLILLWNNVSKMLLLSNIWKVVIQNTTTFFNFGWLLPTLD